MDLVSSGSRVIVTMEHNDKKGNSKVRWPMDSDGRITKGHQRCLSHLSRWQCSSSHDQLVCGGAGHFVRRRCYRAARCRSAP